MRVPCDLSSAELIRRLERLGYAPTRQSGSHVRLTTAERGEHQLMMRLTTRCVSVRYRRFSQRSPRTTASTATTCSSVFWIKAAA